MIKHTWFYSIVATIINLKYEYIHHVESKIYAYNSSIRTYLFVKKIQKKLYKII